MVWLSNWLCKQVKVYIGHKLNKEMSEANNPGNLKITILYLIVFSEYFMHYINQDIVRSSNWLHNKVNTYKYMHKNHYCQLQNCMYRYKNDK